MKRLEDIVEDDAHAHRHPIIYRVDVNVKEIAEINTDSASYSARRAGISVASSSCKKGYTLLGCIDDLRVEGSAHGTDMVGRTNIIQTS